MLGAAADDLYEMKDFPLAIESAHKLIERYPAAERDLLRSAWAVVATPRSTLPNTRTPSMRTRTCWR